MDTNDDLKRRLLASGRRHGYWRSGRAFWFYCRRELLPGIDFRGKRFLDIGAGDGRYSLYAWANGASKIVAVEPQLEGSSDGSLDKLSRMVGELKADGVVILKRLFQELDIEHDAYDVILLHNSINHLDEDMCMKLPHDMMAVEAYRLVARRLRSLMCPEARLIITDCGRGNLSTRWNLRRGSSFNHTIEWHKHQEPKTWVGILASEGFAIEKVSYTGVPRLLFLSYLFKNRLLAYMRWNHFILTFRAV